MSVNRNLPPRMKPIAARKSAILCVLDIGTSKIACLRKLGELCFQIPDHQHLAVKP